MANVARLTSARSIERRVDRRASTQRAGDRRARRPARGRAAPSPARSPGTSPRAADPGSRSPASRCRPRARTAAPTQRERLPVLGAARAARRRRQRAHEDRGSDDGQDDRASHSTLPGIRHAATRLNPHADRGKRSLRSQHVRARVLAACGGVLNRCAYGRSGGCWRRTRSTTSGTRSGSSRSSILVFDRTQVGRAHGRRSSWSRSSCPRCSPPG